MENLLDYVVVAIVLAAIIFLLVRFIKQTFGIGGGGATDGCSGCSQGKNCAIPKDARPKSDCPDAPRRDPSKQR